MNELVFLEPNRIDAKPFTTSDVIATGAMVQHHTVTKLIQKYEDDFKEFGILRFEIEEIKGRGQPVKHYHLNEEQATLLITYLKNTLVVRTFKKELVRQFYLMRTELMQRHLERAQLKPIRREMTDTIKQVDDSKWAYKKYTDLAYKMVTGKIASKLREERGAPKKAVAIDYMSADEIHAISEMQYRIAVLLELGMDYETIKKTLSKRLLLKAG